MPSYPRPQLGTVEMHLSQMIRRVTVLEHNIATAEAGAPSLRWKIAERDALEWAIRKLLELDPMLQRAAEIAEEHIANLYAIERGCPR